MVIWGSLYSSIFLLIYILFITIVSCTGTNKVVVVVVVVVVGPSSTGVMSLSKVSPPTGSCILVCGFRYCFEV